MSFAQPFKNYEILDRVGAGAMGTVFKARQKHLGRIVALKVLKPSLARDARYVERLRREARIVGRLNHPNIVTAYDLGEEGGYHFFVMEFVEGQSLRELLNEWGHFPESQVLDVGMQITEALTHAYDCGVIHRDIKPANVLIDGDGRVKLTDMGLAKAKTDLTLTRDGATVGTPQYISPEQARNPRDVDVRSDLYSLGASLFHMATGQPPFRGETIGELISQVLHDPAPSAHDLDPTISEGLSLVIRKLLSKDPGLRYQNPRELLEDLQRVRRQERPEVDRAALAAGAGRGASAWGPSSPRLWGVVAAAALALAVGGAALAGGVWPFSGDAAADGRSPDGLLSISDLPQSVQDAVAVEPPGARLVAIRQVLRFIQDPAARSVLEQAANLAEAEVRAITDAALDHWLGAGRDETLAMLADPQEWPDPAVFLTTRVKPDLAEKLGSLLAGLPDPKLVAELEQRLGRLGLGLTDAAEMRDRKLLRAFETHLREVVMVGVDTALGEARFADAERWLETIGAGFFDGPEWPARALVGAGVAARLDELEERTRTALEPRIAEARAAAARRLEGEMAAAQRGFEERLQACLEGDEVPSLVAEDVRAFVSGLRSRHPTRRHFGAEAGIWDRIDSEVAQLGLRLEEVQRVFDARSLAAAVRLAHRVFADAGPGAAARVLAAVEGLEGAAAQLLAAHLGLFESVETFLMQVCRTRDGTALTLDTVAGTQVTLRIGPAGELVVTGPELPPDGWRDIAWDRQFAETDLAGPVRKELDQNPDLRLARAFLWMVADQPARALDGLGGPSVGFLQREVWPLLEARVESVAAGERAARDAFRRLVEAYQADEPERVKALLTEFELRHGRSEAARQGKALRARIVGYVEARVRGSDRLATLQARCPDGFVAELDGLDRPTCRGDLGGVGGVVIGPGWRRDGRAIAFGFDAQTRGVLGELSVEGPFGAEQPVDLEVELGVPAETVGLQVFGIAVHGACLALAVLPERELVVIPIGGAEQLRDPEALGRSFAGPLKETLVRDDSTLREPGEVAVLVPGAWHRLTLRIETRRDGDARIQVWLDDARRALWDGPVPREDEDDAPAFRCLSVGPLRLRELRFVARGT